MPSELEERPWDDFLDEWGDEWVKELVDPAVAVPEVPQAWCILADRPTAENLDALWGPVGLPRFKAYLRRALRDVRIAQSEVGWLLVYRLRLWEEIFDGYKDGFMMAGMPASDEHISRLERQVGAVPDSLRGLWSVHGFLLLRDRTFLASVEPEQQRLANEPLNFDMRYEQDPDRRPLECLGIIDVTNTLVTCITRPPGTSAWEDYLVLAHRWGTRMLEWLPQHLDDLLVGREDWLEAE